MIWTKDLFFVLCRQYVSMNFLPLIPLVIPLHSHRLRRLTPWTLFAYREILPTKRPGRSETPLFSPISEVGEWESVINPPEHTNYREIKRNYLNQNLLIFFLSQNIVPWTFTRNHPLITSFCSHRLGNKGEGIKPCTILAYGQLTKPWIGPKLLLLISSLE